MLQTLFFFYENIKRYDHHFQEQNHNNGHHDYPDIYHDHQDAFPHHLLLWILSEDRHKGDRSSQFGKKSLQSHDEGSYGGDDDDDDYGCGDDGDDDSDGGDGDGDVDEAVTMG